MGALRCFFALAVVAWHISIDNKITIFSGEIAVISFYCISGFYMALVLNTKYSQLSISVFYLNRFLRLFPLYIFLHFVTGAILFINWRLRLPSQLVCPCVFEGVPYVFQYRTDWSRLYQIGRP